MAQYNYYNEKGLESTYNKLESLYDTYKIEESSRIFRKFNEDLVTIIDKSLTRDSKLDEILDGK
jgi:molecular chaperone GrpE (heat shock protein)